MPDIVESNVIAGLKTVTLTEFADSRGRFVETFRKEWFPERTWEIVQANRSDSAEHVLRGLHFHHHQVDYWYPLRGRIRVGLYDLRKSSPTRGGGVVMGLGGIRGGALGGTRGGAGGGMGPAPVRVAVTDGGEAWAAPANATACRETRVCSSSPMRSFACRSCPAVSRARAAMVSFSCIKDWIFV